MMTQVTARVPDELVEALDAAAAQLKRSRADVVRQARSDTWKTTMTSL